MSKEAQQVEQVDTTQNNEQINEQVNLIIDHYSTKLAQTELELALAKSELAMIKKEKGDN